MIIFELIYNLSLLVAVSVLSGFVDSRYKRDTLQGKIFQGILFGITSIIGMMYPFVFFEGIIFDGRSVALSICGLFFGPIPALIAGIFSIAYRLSIGGSGWLTGVLVITESVITGLAFYYYFIKKPNKINTLHLFYMGIIVHIIMLFLMIGLPIDLKTEAFKSIGITILTLYPLATIIMGKIFLDLQNNTHLIADLTYSKDTLNKYIASAPDAVFVVNKSGQYVEANEAAEIITGYTKAEILKKSIYDFIHPDEKDFAKNHFNQVINEGRAFGTSKFIKKDGTVGWWTVEAVKINDDRYLGFSKDITQKKNSEVEMEETLNKFKVIFDLAPDAMIIINLKESIYIDINTRFEEISGYTREELINQHSSKFNFWFFPKHRTEFLYILNISGKVIDFITDFRDRNGNKINVSISGSLIYIKNEPFALCILSDISNQKKIENDLKSSEEKFRNLIEKLPDGFYQSTPAGKFIFVNPAFVKMLGYDSKEDLMSIDISTELYFSLEDRQIGTFDNSEFSDKYEIYPLKRKDGKPVWIEDHTRYLSNDEGTIILHEGICRDITDRIEIERANVELINRIKKISYHLPGFIFQLLKKTDGTMGFSYTSDGIYEIFGVHTDEVKDNANKLFSHIHPDDFDLVRNGLFNSAKSLAIWKDEFRVILDEKNVRWLNVVASPEEEKDGVVIWHGYLHDISERKKSEEVLKESEFSLRFAQEIAGMGSWEIIISTNKLIWSENYFYIYGYDPKTYVPDHKSFLQRVHPEDVDFVISEIDKFSKVPASTEFEFRIILPDGNLKWILNSVVPIYKNNKLISIKGINLDITERKRADNELRKLSRAVQQSPLAILITNTNGDIEYVNPKFSEFTGYAFDEVVGKNPRILKSGVMPDDFYKDMWATLLDGKQWQGEILNKRKNGELYWESVIIAPVNNEKGVITNFIAIKDDITEKKKFFEELIIAKEKAIESEKLKTAFLANMSHEIRTPLNGIIGFSRMLSESDLASEERQEYSKILNQSCDRLLNTVNDILDISKIESNQMEVRFSLFYLKNVIQELYELHIGNFSKKSINLILNLKQIDDELIIYSDEQKIYQILNNLINNAYKFTELGEVEIGASIKNDYIEFFVRDTGIGISESAIDFIFGRFNQENNNLNRGFEGTGLGLSICKGLVNLLGGKIWLESSQGLGSKFSFNIPYFKNQ